ncbi:hypothetical protein LOC67_16765 [Stieleria sp. JC731]|uniref:hypothetical protein n=1 Tax=Pirellulaceae TaxID=2691357 RepID=UPI001E5880DD|nr:hypothetical protein [Stieleria sp. JC731]MCC9602210.1 hypothetical protein [Stieleria sp. JC731]
MNGPTSEDPHPVDESGVNASGPTEAETDGAGPPNVEQPFVAKMVSPSPDAALGSGEESIRVGSPFRIDPPRRRQVAIQKASGEAAYADYGPFLYTSMGAASSAVVILAFAALGYFWFPIGGVLVTMLGIGLSLLGLFSNKRFRIAAISALPLHLGLFLLCYTRALT